MVSNKPLTRGSSTNSGLWEGWKTSRMPTGTTRFSGPQQPALSCCNKMHFADLAKSDCPVFFRCGSRCDGMRSSLFGGLDAAIMASTLGNARKQQWMAGDRLQVFIGLCQAREDIHQL